MGKKKTQWIHNRDIPVAKDWMRYRKREGVLKKSLFLYKSFYKNSTSEAKTYVSGC